MLVRTLRRKTTQNVSVQIVESTRVPGKGPRQRIIKHMGAAPEGPLLDALVRLAHRAKLRLLEERQPTLFPMEYWAARVQGARQDSQSDQPLPIPDARKLVETKRLIMGVHEVFGTLYDRMGFQKVFGARKKMAARLFRQAVLMRLAAPGSSKRACCGKLSRHHGVEVNPDKFYRMMDTVNDDRIARLQSIVSHEVRGLLQERVDVLFFDVTTLSFASDKGEDLRKKGFSKIDRDACFDGLHGMWTSLDRDNHPAQHIYAYYEERWRIEEGFRVRKHTMATRPIDHWTPSRVKAHIAICFVAFALLRLLRYQHNTMHAGQEPLSEARILAELSGAQVSLITDTSTLKQYLLASPATAAQRTLYSAAGLKYPSRTRELADPGPLA